MKDWAICGCCGGVELVDEPGNVGDAGEATGDGAQDDGSVGAPSLAQARPRFTRLVDAARAKVNPPLTWDGVVPEGNYAVLYPIRFMSQRGGTILVVWYASPNKGDASLGAFLADRADVPSKMPGGVWYLSKFWESPAAMVEAYARSGGTMPPQVVGSALTAEWIGRLCAYSDFAHWLRREANPSYRAATEPLLNMG